MPTPYQDFITATEALRSSIKADLLRQLNNISDYAKSQDPNVDSIRLARYKFLIDTAHANEGKYSGGPTSDRNFYEHLVREVAIEIAHDFQYTD